MEKWTTEKKDVLVDVWRKAKALYNKKDPNYNDYLNIGEDCWMCQNAM